MAKLTGKQRKALPAKDFAGPGRSYPIPDKPHARNALARAAQHASPVVAAEVRAKVHRDFPSIDRGNVRMAAASKSIAKEVGKRVAARNDRRK